MVDLAFGCVYGGDEKKYTYFRVHVTGPGGYLGYASAGQNRHAKYSQRPNLIRGFHELSGNPGDIYTFTPQWRVSSSTSEIHDVEGW